MRNANDSDETAAFRNDAMHIAGWVAGLSALGAIGAASNYPSWPAAVVPSVAILIVVVVCS
ncbi:MAG: hypothetical protein WCH39_16515 [Schlesneria sp.]